MVEDTNAEDAEVDATSAVKCAAAADLSLATSADRKDTSLSSAHRAVMDSRLSVVLAEEDAEVSSREMVETDPGECATTSRTEAATEETLADSLTTK